MLPQLRATIPALVALSILSGWWPGTLGAQVISPGVYRDALVTELPAFADSLLRTQMGKYHVPGAAIVVVSRDSVIFARAYGVADMESRRPLTLDTHLKMGSISKVVVATAVLQLAEEGRVDLHADVNEYLNGLRLRNRFDQPVTLHHLLTHSSGIDRPYLGIASRTTEVQPLEAFLVRNFPWQVRAPGELYAYSDYGMALAGHIVERITGETFAERVQERVIRPAGMSRSTFHPQAIPDSAFAKGYRWDGERHIAYPLVNLHLLPSGGLSSTPADMGQLLRLLLNGGSANGSRVLSDSSTRTMLSRQFGHHPDVPGVGYAFHEDWYYEGRAFRHNGWMSGHSTVVYAVPSQDLAYMLVYTAGVPDEAVWRLTQRLQGHIVRTPAPADPVIPAGARPTRDYVGTYRMMEYAEHGLERSAHLLLAPTVQIELVGDGRLLLVREEGNVPLVQVERGVFQWEDGYARVVFRDWEGRLQLLSANQSYVRVTWNETPILHAAVLGGGLLVFASAPLVFGGSYFWRRRRGRSVGDTRLSRVAIGTATAFCLAAVIMLAGIVPAFTSMDVNLLAMGAPPLLAAALRMPILLAILLIPLPVLAILVWRFRSWGIGSRVYYSAIAIVAILFVVCLHALGFLSLRTGATGPALVREVSASGAPSTVLPEERDEVGEGEVAPYLAAAQRDAPAITPSIPDRVAPSGDDYKDEGHASTSR